MQLDIRSFKNTDAQQICRVWNAHQDAAGLDALISLLSFELCVLAKPYFNSELLSVAEMEGKVVGFSHLGYGPAKNLLEIDSQRAILCCLCVDNHPLEAQIASELLTRVAMLARSQNSPLVQTVSTAPSCPFYLGLAPGDGVMGILVSDTRLRGWLSAAGFEATQGVTGWELDLAQFHPPIDRLQVQIRRMAHVDRRLDEPLLPWWVACMLGHTDQVGFQLTLRKEKRVACEALLWMIDHEVEPREGAVARLWLRDQSISAELSDYYVFLLSEAFRHLFIDRVQIVRAFTSSDDASIANILQRIGLLPTQAGTVFTKHLAT